MSGNLSVSQTGDYLLRDGKSFFYFADTSWCAFYSPTVNEWEEYLDFRKRQGFNVLQINILPQWDASEHTPKFLPFEKISDTEYDYFKINARFFDKACEFLQMARERGFIPALVLLWLNYVPGTWGAQMKLNNVMPFEAVRPYTEYVVKRFAEFDPIYFISGDTDFQTDEPARYYMEALNTVKEISPHSLTTMHLTGQRSDLPEQFVESEKLDFYTYQSGHGLGDQHCAYHLAEAFLQKKRKKPIINAEPCYEGHGHANQFGRFSAYEVRRAVWQSLLSGAKAGVAYGAHGIWSFHHPGAKFPSVRHAGLPFDFRDALRLEGAWDSGFAKWVFETYSLFDVEPVRAVRNETEEIRCAMSPDRSKFAVYMPISVPLELKFDVSPYRLSMIELTGRRILTSEYEVVENGSRVMMCPFNSDAVLVGVL